MKDFTISALPRLVFGSGAIYSLPKLLKEAGVTRTAVITGGGSLDASGWWKKIESSLNSEQIAFERYTVAGEPSPQVVDEITTDARKTGCRGVVGIGGGSVIDAAKAVSAMITEPAGVREYLEGVGTRKPSGTRVYLAAVPTTAGTGSEATKNAVISQTGQGGFKKSLRHDHYIPDLALLDPMLSLDCPPAVTAASGLDAVTQLLESYVSVQANAFTDALALEGLSKTGRSLNRAVNQGRDEQARGDMAFGAYLSGITLANAGLGVVHGVAGVLGGMVDIPHGIACGTLLAESTRMIIDALKDRGDSGRYALKKFARAGYALTGEEGPFDRERGWKLLTDQLFAWQDLLEKGSLSLYGVTAESAREAAVKADNKQAPVSLNTQEITELLMKRL